MQGSKLLTLLGGKSLEQQAMAWQSRAAMVHAGGMAAASFVTNSNVSGGATAGGRTFISGIVTDRIRQDGYIRQIKVSVPALGADNQWKFKVFRPDGANYAFVSESETMTIGPGGPGGMGVYVITLAQPMACQPGDILGCWLSASPPIAACNVKTVVATPGIRWTAGDIVDTNAFATTINDFALCLEGLTNPPFLCGTGDSIAQGHGGATPWHSFYDGGPAGDPTHEIWNQLRAKVGNGQALQYQNHAKGSQTFAWVLSTGAVSALAVGPHVLVVHCGVNDVSTAREWSAVEADLDAIAALINAQSPAPRLVVDEILPWTNGTDAQAATVRTWNANLATWCAANGAILVRCHDAMGQIRATTGELDDLKAAYNQDGVHLTNTGVNALARIIANVLNGAGEL